MANMRRSRTGDWSVVIGPGPTVHFFYTFSFSSLVSVVYGQQHFSNAYEWVQEYVGLR